MNGSLHASFVVVSLLILLVPGPSMAHAVAVAGRSSRREILLNVAGMALCGFVIVLLLALGLAPLLQTTPVAHTVLQARG